MGEKEQKKKRKKKGKRKVAGHASVTEPRTLDTWPSCRTLFPPVAVESAHWTGPNSIVESSLKRMSSRMKYKTAFYWLFLLLRSFNRVVVGFQQVEPDVYWVFTAFDRVLPSFPFFFTDFYWVLLGSTGFYMVLLGFTEFYWVSPGFTGFFWVLLGFTGFYWVLLGFKRF